MTVTVDSRVYSWGAAKYQTQAHQNSNNFIHACVKVER